MTVQGFTDQGSTTADTLLAGEFPRVSELATITGGSYKRGTVLKASGDALTICGASDTPEAILAEAVDATSEDKQAVVYLTGEFNSAALTVAGGASADGLKAKYYDAQPTAEEFVYQVNMPDIRKAKNYIFDVYASENLIASGLQFNVKSEVIVEKDLF